MDYHSLPALEWERHVWEGAHVAPIGPAATRLSSYGQTYSAAVPPLIGELNIETERDVALLAREAEIELTRLDAEAGGKLGAFGPILLRSEAASSSQIENLTASARQIFTAEVGGKAARNASEIVANSRAMIEAIHISDRLSVDAVLRMHAELMKDQPRHTPGKFRDEPVWIGTSADSPVGATYVAPHHSRVHDLMYDLARYAHREDINPLEHIAVTHAQFETIHPFTDGNGRTGRALAQAMLRNSGVTRTVVVPVSAGLLTDVEGYHRALTMYREGDPSAIVEAFAAAALRAVPNARILVNDLDAIYDAWLLEAKPRTRSVKERIMRFAMTHPVFTADMVAFELEVATPNIYRYLKELHSNGILAMQVEYQGPQLWRAPAVLNAIDAFAERTGRRAFGH